MPKDSATWSLYISIAAVILIVPLGILTNVITPKLQNWWAGRSRASLTRRVHKLRCELAMFQESVLLTEVEQHLFKAFESIMKFVWFVGYFVLSTLGILGLTLIPKQTTERLSWAIAILVFLGIFTFIYGSMLSRLAQYRQKHSPGFEERTQVAIDKLVAELINFRPSSE
jgi:hypothetical protein